MLFFKTSPSSTFLYALWFFIAPLKRKFHLYPVHMLREVLIKVTEKDMLWKKKKLCRDFKYFSHQIKICVLIPFSTNISKYPPMIVTVLQLNKMKETFLCKWEAERLKSTIKQLGKWSWANYFILINSGFFPKHLKKADANTHTHTQSFS